MFSEKKNISFWKHLRKIGIGKRKSQLYSFYIDVYWKILNRNTNVCFTGTRFFFVSQVFLSYLGECFSGLAQICFGECLRFVENLLGNQWIILRNKWNFLRNKWFFWETHGTFWETNGTFWETNVTFWETNGTCWETNGTFWETNGNFWEFLRNFVFLGILPFILVFALSSAIWTFWEKWKILRNKWNILRNKWNILRKMETFEKKWNILRIFEKHIFFWASLDETVSGQWVTCSLFYFFCFGFLFCYLKRQLDAEIASVAK